MKRIEINVNGTAYPCSPTMGAMLRFKQQTGREITEIDPTSFTDLCTYLWCCAVSASKREGKAFEMSLLDFADAVTPDDMAAWNEAISSRTTSDGSEAPEGEKKSL
nr:MAG TPA: tail assembly chaperone protein [Caudoviricetes sp.]